MTSDMVDMLQNIKALKSMDRYSLCYPILTWC